MIDSDIRTLFSEALTEEPPASPALADDLARGRRLRRRRHVRIAAATATAGVAVVTSLAVVVPEIADQSPAVEFQVSSSTQNDGDADGPPRLLIDDPDWSIESVREEDPDKGSLNYQRAVEVPTEIYVHINWERGDTPLEERVDEWDEPEDSYEATSASIASLEAKIVALDSGTHSLIWNQDGYEMFVGSNLPTRQDFEELLNTVRQVDLETWAAAMPDGYSPVYDNREAAAAITSQVPVVNALAPGVGEESMYYSVLNHIDPSDEDAFREEVIYWVACTWVSQWIAAQHPDSPESVDTADLRTVVEWAQKNGAMTDDVVWDYVREIIDGEPDHEAMLTAALDELRCVTGR